MSSQAHRMYSKDSLPLISYFLQDWFSVLLEYDDVSERSLLTTILSNGGSFYNSSYAHTTCSQQLWITCYGQQRFSFTDLIILKLLVGSYQSVSCLCHISFFYNHNSEWGTTETLRVDGDDPPIVAFVENNNHDESNQPNEYGTDKNILETWL